MLGLSFALLGKSLTNLQLFCRLLQFCHKFYAVNHKTCMFALADYPFLVSCYNLERQFRPSTAVSVAVASTVAPIGEGRRCVVVMAEPTVVLPSSRSDATQSIAAFSISATIAGVASTSKSPEPSTEAHLSAVTTICEV